MAKKGVAWREVGVYGDIGNKVARCPPAWWCSAVFLSRSTHSLDDKGRVILPVRWRGALEGGAFVTEYSNGCLAVFDPQEFMKVAERVRSVSQRGASERFMTLSFFSSAVEVAPDKQGRIAIASHLREYANLDGDVVLAGHFDHIEIWNPLEYDRRKGEGTTMLHSERGIGVFSGP